ncbi:hypothetical protein TNCV_3592531 [Trichonephila clavipes]|nr:hypothetical protein TNCV_3592531 [Trichonephila clavipes]
MYGHMANWRGCPCFPKPPKGTALNNRNSYTNIYNSIIRPNVSYAQAANPNKISTNFNSQNKQPMAPKGPVNSAQIEANRNPSANNRSIPNFNNKSNNNFNGYNFNGNIFNNNNFNLQATLQMTMQCLCQLSQFTQAIATSNPNFMNNFNQVQRANNNPNQILINPNQYGFTNKLSTLHPLLRLTESISEGFQKEEHGSGLSGYPESLRPCLILGLTFKLITYDIPSPLIHLIHSYSLTDPFGSE